MFFEFRIPVVRLAIPPFQSIVSKAFRTVVLRVTGLRLGVIGRVLLGSIVRGVEGGE